MELASSSIAKCQKQDFDGEIDVNNVLNMFSDDILCHILSFLPIKQAATTSVVCRRLRYLWVSSSDLCFDDRRFANPGLFKDLVDRVFALRGMWSINKFCLDCVHSYDASQINAWISAAILQNIEEFDLRVSEDKVQAFVHVPTRIFTLEKLSVLKLYGKIAFSVPEHLHCPNLKGLHLACLGYMIDNNCIRKMLTGCPNLEELVIHWSTYQVNMRNLCIRSSSLKCLSIRRVPSHNFVSGTKGLVIDTPNLESLELRDYETDDFEVVKLPLLVKANIDVKQSMKSRKMIYVYARGVMMNVIKQIVEVKDLCLSSNTMSVLCEAFFVPYPVFHNLTTLNIRGDREIKTMMLPKLLTCLPVLEVFIFDKIYEWHQWNTEGHIPQCCLSSLRIIECLKFTGSYREMEISEFFLKNSLCLEKMVIHLNKVHDSDSDITNNLLSFARGSNACQVTIL